MDKQDYKDYLCSEDWRERRKELMEEADWTCSICGAKATQLHHLKYDNLGFEMLDEDVMALCNKCHKEIHNKEDSGYGEYTSW